MRELYYTPLDLAAIINSLRLSAREQAELLDRIWERDRAYIDPEYRGDRRKLLLKYFYWSHYLYDKPAIDREFPLLKRDLWLSQGTLRDDEYLSDHAALDIFFKAVRVRLLCDGQKDHVRIKLRTLLKRYGYRNRSPKLMEYMDKCLLFYDLRPYLRGGELCDLRTVDREAMIMFRRAESAVSQ